MILINKKKQNGLTIIEVMVALTISMILMGGVIQLFLSNKQTYRTTEALSRLQENARFALGFLTPDIRMAGFQGCRNRGAIVTNNVDPDYAADNNIDIDAIFDTDGAIEGYSNSDGDPDIDGDGTDELSAAPLVGSDILLLQFADSCDGYITGNLLPDNANIEIATPNSCGLEKNALFMISDCQTADIAGISNTPGDATSVGSQTITHAANINIGPKLGTIYSSDAEIFSFKSYTFYLALNANGNPSLWRQDNTMAGTPTEELVEGIEDMQISYGVDTDSDKVADIYMKAAALHSDGTYDMDDVVSIRMSLTASTTADNVSITTSTVSYAARSYTDKRIRKTFNATIALRNRLE